MQLMGSGLISVMSKSLDGMWERQKTISENMANYETPGYKRKYVSFENQLQQAISGSSSSSQLQDKLNNVQIQYGQENDTVRMDGNSVDLEEESIEMIRTTYQYSYAQRVLSDEFSRISTAINEGK